MLNARFAGQPLPHCNAPFIPGKMFGANFGPIAKTRAVGLSDVVRAVQVDVEFGLQQLIVAADGADPRKVSLADRGRLAESDRGSYLHSVSFLDGTPFSSHSVPPEEGYCPVDERPEDDEQF